MTAPQAPQEAPGEADGVLRDMDGEPFYIGAVSTVGTDKDKPGAVVPGLDLMINGKSEYLHAGTGFRTGIGLLSTAVNAEAVGIALSRIPGRAGLQPGVSLRVGSLPTYEIPSDVARSVAEMLIGASISAVHDAAVWRHLTQKKGYSEEAAEDVLNGIETVHMMQFLYSGERAI